MMINKNQQHGQHHGMADLAVQIIDYHIAKDGQQREDELVIELVNRFNTHYKQKGSVPAYVAFDTHGDRGIPLLVRYFSGFDPVNAEGEFGAWSAYTNPTDLQMKHAYSYMIAPEFNRELLRTTQFDHVVHALYSYLLHWTNEGLTCYGERYPQFKPLTMSVILEKERSPVYVTKDGVPFVRSAFRMLLHYINGVERQHQTAGRIERRLFRITNYVSPVLFGHFKDVYQWLLNESMTRREIELLETPMDSPFASTAIQYRGAGYLLNNPVKVITGQACCGKTTLLNKLKSYGWTVCSRGDLGTFSGKSKSAPAIASLHAAIENALRRGDVLGDRGPIDNPLWAIIMPLCDPQYKDRVVEELMQFFDSTLNEHVAAYMCAQQAVIFVDPYPGLNRARMMRRSADGDAFRCRIQMYPIAQFMAYYMAARLYGWTVRCVPYDEEHNFQPHRYLSMAEEINKLFGSPIKQEPLKQASKQDGHHLEDTEYSIATGIFK